MCGIHGVVTGTKREPGAEKFIQQGFVAGSLRGMDSSGFASVKVAQKDVAYQKMPLPGTMFMIDKYAQRLASDACAPGTVSICHTRAATSGGVGLEQCHPFLVTGVDGDDVRELIGVHNGSLTGWSTKPGSKEFKVDSEWALNHIFDEGFDAFEDFTGAFVFCWWDSASSEVFNIALNDARPLYIAFTDEGSMLYASEAGMLWWLAERNNIKLDGKVKQLLGGYWYRFPMGKFKEYTKTALPKAKTSSSGGSGAASDYYGRAYNQPDHTASVQNLINTLTGKTTALVPANAPTFGETPTDARRPKYCTAEEVMMAKEAGYSRARGEFHPLWDDADTGEIWGTYIHHETKVELDAIIRNVDTALLDFKPMHDVWEVEVIGMLDDGLRLSAVCTHPIRRDILDDQTKKQQTATAEGE